MSAKARSGKHKPSGPRYCVVRIGGRVRRRRRYRDKVDALLALASTGSKRHTRREKEEKRAYECPACGGYHLTSQPEKRTG